MKVDGASVLLTGASSGIGAALAPMLAEAGARVALVARREDRLLEVLERCQPYAPGSQIWICDLDDPGAAEECALEVEGAFGAVDILINNAAIPKRRRVTDLSVAEFQQTMRVNLESPVRMTLSLLPGMLERGRGSIVNVSSLGGRLGITHETAYCAAKFGLSGWSEAMALDLWDTPIEVRLIQPGPIDTEIWDQPGNDAALYDGPLEPPSVVAEGIVAAIEGTAFEHYLPDLKGVVEFKTSDIDTFLAGSAEAMRPKGDDG
ncbi:MAG: SDR family NAD(P)-dependent oxidoreductase [Acidimicrobiales bacterium]